MRRFGRAAFGLYPAAFAATYVLLAFTATPNPVFSLWRPLMVAAVAAGAIQLVVLLVLRRRDRAALVASVIVLAGLATWVPLMVVVGGGMWLGALSWLARRRGTSVAWSESRLSRLAGTFGWALAMIAAVSAAATSVSFMPAPANSATVGGDGPRSDVVLLLLDGYPRADALEEQFSIDLEPFHHELERRGFVVARGSRSNYTSSWMTIASMVHGRYVEEIEGLDQAPAAPADQYRRLMRSIGEGEMLDALRRQGYEIVSVPSPYESASITTADHILAPPELTSFELSLIQHSLAGRIMLEVAPWIAFEQHRDRVRSTLQMTVEAAASRSNPRFVFAHLMAPHAPIAFGADDPAPRCFPACSLYAMGREPDWSGYAAHLSVINDLVLDAIDRVRAGSSRATIIVMSDHGTVRNRGHRGPNAFRSFFAASVPDGSVQFPPDITPIDVLRLVVGSGAQPHESYRAWTSKPEAPMSVTPVHGQGAP